MSLDSEAERGWGGGVNQCVGWDLSPAARGMLTKLCLSCHRNHFLPSSSVMSWWLYTPTLYFSQTSEGLGRGELAGLATGHPRDLGGLYFSGPQFPLVNREPGFSVQKLCLCSSLALLTGTGLSHSCSWGKAVKPTALGHACCPAR